MRTYVFCVLMFNAGLATVAAWNLDPDDEGSWIDGWWCAFVTAVNVSGALALLCR